MEPASAFDAFWEALEASEFACLVARFETRLGSTISSECPEVDNSLEHLLNLFTHPLDIH